MLSTMVQWYQGNLVKNSNNHDLYPKSIAFQEWGQVMLIIEKQKEKTFDFDQVVRYPSNIGMI